MPDEPGGVPDFQEPLFNFLVVFLSNRPDFDLLVGIPFLLVLVLASSAGQPEPLLHERTPRQVREMNKTKILYFRRMSIFKAF